MSKFSIKVTNEALGYPHQARNFEVTVNDAATQFSVVRDAILDHEQYTPDIVVFQVGDKVIQASEINQTLQELGIVSGATLTLKRAAKFTDPRYQSLYLVEDEDDEDVPTFSTATAVGVAPQTEEEEEEEDDDYDMGGSGERMIYIPTSMGLLMVPQSRVMSMGGINLAALTGMQGGARGSPGGNRPRQAPLTPSDDYLGLSNQGATCYMNSLIQTLFMTPEFRAAVYNWSFDAYCKEAWEKRKLRQAEKDQGTTQSLTASQDIPLPKEDDMKSEEDLYNEWKNKHSSKSIPLQLQKLFAHLQLGDSSCKTKDLTKSFGWTDEEAFTQHDVQELCRVLFDALEKAWTGTGQGNLINQLYQGEMKDYVQCMVCGNESSRTDKYLDIPLVIKAFGSEVSVKSVEEALAKFIESEELTGDNQYSCEHCKKKVDAKKGLKFTSFPYLLTLQLKRFDFDYVRMRRIKLNNRVVFPRVLNLNKYLDGHKSADDALEEALDDLQSYSTEGGSTIPTVSDLIERALEDGPDVYELFAVLIHKGSSLGGHYYAYIKNLSDQKWYEFNDSAVYSLPEGRLVDAYGDEDAATGGMSALLGSGANAYMLVYRRHDPSKNIDHGSKESVPSEIKNIVIEEKDAKQVKDLEKAKEREMVMLKVFNRNNESRTFKLHKTTSLRDVLARAAEEFKLTQVAPENMRLREYSIMYDLPQGVVKMDGTIEDYGLSAKPFFIETKKAEQEWIAYDPTKKVIRVFLWTREKGWEDEPIDFYVDRKCTMGVLRQSFQEQFGIEAKKQIIVKETFGERGGVHIPERYDQVTLSDCRIIDGGKIWVEPLPEGDERKAVLEELRKYSEVEDEDPEKPYEDLARAFVHIRYLKDQLTVNFNMPDSDVYDQSVTLTKSSTLLELKQKMLPILGLEVTQFIVYKGSGQIQTELTRESHKLKEYFWQNDSVVKVTIRRGSPRRNGEVSIKVELYEIPEDDICKGFSPLFDIDLREDMLVKDAKVEIAKKMKEKNAEKFGSLVAEHLRIREVSSRLPTRIFRDNETLKEAARVITSNTVLLVQVLGHVEPKVVKSQEILYVQEFHSAEMKFGKPIEMLFDDADTLSGVAKKISEVTGVSSINIAKYYGFKCPEILDVPSLDWSKHKSESTLKSCCLTDGDVILWRNSEVAFKELSKEETAALKKQETKRRIPSSSYFKEKNLVINQHDINADDE